MAQNLRIGAAYISVSTDDQAELSPDAQLRVIMDEAKKDGFLIPSEYIFEEKRGISGRKADNRPEFQRMISIAKSQVPAPFERCISGSSLVLQGIRNKAHSTREFSGKNAELKSKVSLSRLQTECLDG